MIFICYPLKKLDMKKISIVLIWVLLLSSCIKDYSTLTEFVIENNLEHVVKIQVSNFETEFYSSVDTIFTIGVGSKINYNYEKDGEDAVYEYPFGASSDSIIIHFNDTVSSIFSKNKDSQYNPLKIENYSGGRIKKGLYRYTYTFTNQDFQEALKD
jgi:hypothetical protein